MPAPVNINPVNISIDTASIASTIPQAPPPFTPQPPVLPDPGPVSETAAPQTSSSSPAQVTKEQLQAQLDAALKNSGIKTEIENERSGLVIVRFVQADTGQLILQMPPQGVLDLVADLEKQIEANQSPLAGQIVDTKV
jgi:uncharacterized FlaG/YvyC family protein